MLKSRCLTDYRVTILTHRFSSAEKKNLPVKKDVILQAGEKTERLREESQH